MLKPRALRAGDKVAIVSPASPFERDEFERGAQELRRLGFEPVHEKSLFARTGYVSGSAELRAQAFLTAWNDPSIAALIAVRGGYGSVHLLPHFNSTEFRRRPKLFVGYSDTTSVLTWLTCVAGIAALHGPMLEGRLAKGSDGYDESSFLRLVKGERNVELAPAGTITLHEGEAAGPLFGGNLTQLISSLGTPYAFDPPPDCILFLEDVNERPYRLDRMLTQLRLSGILERARGLVFGEMRGCDDAGGQPCASDVVAALTREFPGPVVIGFPSGHTTGATWSLPLGVRVRVTAGSQPAIAVEEPLVG